MTIMVNLFVCALVLMALAAFWILVSVWLDRGEDRRSKLVRGDDPRADKSQPPVEKDRDFGWYPLKECTQCKGDPDGCMNCNPYK